MATQSEIDALVKSAGTITGPNGERLVVLIEGEVTDPALLSKMSTMKREALSQYGNVLPAFVGQEVSSGDLYVILQSRTKVPYASVFEEKLHIGQWRTGQYGITTTLHTTAGKFPLDAGQTRELDAAVKILKAHYAGNPDITAAVVNETVKNLASHLGVQDVKSVANILEQLAKSGWHIGKPAAIP